MTQLQIADFVENIHRDAPDPAEVTNIERNTKRKYFVLKNLSFLDSMGREQFAKWFRFEVLTQIYQCSIFDFTKTKYFTTVRTEH